MLEKITAWLAELIEKYVDWFLELVLWLPKKIWSLMLEGFATFIESIDPPQFMLDAQSFWGGIPGGIVYFMDFFAVAEGMGMIAAALALRFIVRRIPLIG